MKKLSILTDQNILAAFPQAAERDETGKFPTIVYNHETTANTDGSLTQKISVCRYVQKMDGSGFFIRKTLEGNPQEHALGSEFPESLVMWDTTIPITSVMDKGRGYIEPLLNAAGNPSTANQLPLKRVIGFTGPIKVVVNESVNIGGYTQIVQKPITLNLENDNYIIPDPVRGVSKVPHAGNQRVTADSAFSAMTPEV